MTIECGGVRATDGLKRPFEHKNGDDVFKITLTGKAEGKGGHVFWQCYLLQKSSTPRSFGEFLVSPYVDISRVEEKYITGRHYDVEAGKEIEISNTGLYARGS